MGLVVHSLHGQARWPTRRSHLIPNTGHRCSGYLQIEIEKSDRDKTAFTPSHIYYHFIRVFFRFRNAPGKFRRSKKLILSKVKLKFALKYLYDITMFSRTIKKHIYIVRHVITFFTSKKSHSIARNSCSVVTPDFTSGTPYYFKGWKPHCTLRTQYLDWNQPSRLWNWAVPRVMQHIQSSRPQLHETCSTAEHTPTEEPASHIKGTQRRRIGSSWRSQRRTHLHSSACTILP